MSLPSSESLVTENSSIVNDAFGRLLLRSDSVASAESTSSASLSPGRKPCWLCKRAPVIDNIIAESVSQMEKIPLATGSILQLCAPCFSDLYKVAVLPIIQARKAPGPLAAKLQLAADQNLDDPALQALDRCAAVLRVARWTCHRCSRSNIARDETCQVCQALNPRLLKCEHCTLNMQKAPQVCPKMQKVHKVWDCSACTSLNTVATEHCQMCNSARTWKCGRCSSTNDTPRNFMGERTCPRCGHSQLEMTASIFQNMGGDREEFLREERNQNEMHRSEVKLTARLQTLGVKSEVQVGDGNCQFRAISKALFGSPDYHMLVRHLIFAWLSREKAASLKFFSTAPEQASYIESMGRGGTWGDEITLAVCAVVFGVHVHIITSVDDHWHQEYRPDQLFGETQHGSPSSQPEAVGRIFLMYLSPCHYDGIFIPEPQPLPDLSARNWSSLMNQKLRDLIPSNPPSSGRSSGGTMTTSSSGGNPTMTTTTMMKKPDLPPPHPPKPTTQPTAAAPPIRLGAPPPVPTTRPVVTENESIATRDAVRPSTAYVQEGGSANWMLPPHEEDSTAVIRLRVARK